jgi:small-conductance mechanosensitive channel
MQSLFSLATLEGAAQSLRAWVEFNVLIWSTLEQAVCALVLLLLFLAVLRPLRRGLVHEAERIPFGPLHHIAVALAKVGPWITLLLTLWFATLAFRAAGQRTNLLLLLESAVLAWVVIRLSSRLVRDPRLSQAVALAAWIIAALNIAGLINPALGLLDAMAVPVGNFRLSLLLVLKGTVILAAFIWIANTLARIADQRLRRLPNLTPAMQVLAAKLLRLTLLTLAVVLALGSIGIDLTAFAVFSGAIGVGVGFGLQKVVSNLVSGVILLLDRSIKPGDVIEINNTYGWITRLNARYVSVVTRDGKEFLIPNEDLITERVTNWSYSNELVRLHVPVGVSYQSDLHLAIKLALEAAATVPRALREPAPVCLVTGFGDSAVNLDLRFWINDPRNGTSNVRSQVMLNIWDLYRQHGIEIPFPQRDLTIRNPEVITEAVARAMARPTRRVG